MDALIITLTNERRSFSVDVELPVHVPVSKLKNDLYEALNMYDASIGMTDPEAFSLFCTRSNMKLAPEQTLSEAGVWNGDYLLIMPD